MRVIYPTSDEKSKALSLINTLFEHNFYDAISYHKTQDKYGESYQLHLINWREEHQELIKHLGISFFWGLTKVCIIDPTNPKWVIKIGFDRTTNPYYTEENTAFDFCAREVDNYCAAVDNELDKYFAATFCITSLHNLSITIQEAVTIDEDAIFTQLENYVRDWYDVDDFEDEDDYNSSVSSAAEDLDNEDRIYAILGNNSDNLIKFINHYNINDLQSGNWGIANDGSFIMIDFSGYVD